MSKASGNTRTRGANIALDGGGVKKQIYDYYNEVFDKNVKSLTKELNEAKLSEKQKTILKKRVQAYKNDNLRGTEKGFIKDLNEYQKKYGKITGLNSSLFLKDSIAYHAQERAYRSIIPQIEKKLKR